MFRKLGFALLVLSFSVPMTASAQWNVVGTTRSVSSNTTTDSNSAAGNYTKTINFDDTGTYTQGSNGPTYTVNQHGTAAQNSNALTTDLSGSGSATAGTSYTSDGAFSGTVETISKSSYLVDFTVDSPTPFLFYGTVTATGSYHTGPLEHMTASYSLSIVGQAGSLYSKSDNFGLGFTIGPQNFSDPFSYGTTLQPGNTYELSMNITSDAPRQGGIGAQSYAPATTTFNFTTAVPEPTSALLVLPALLLMKRRAKC